MFYLITKNSQILLGPVAWNPGYFSNMLKLRDIVADFPLIEPNGYLETNGLQIYPVMEMLEPAHNSLYEELAGPYWEFKSNSVSGFYKVRTRPIHTTKRALYEKVASVRYTKEVQGVKVTVAGIDVTCDTSREGKLPFITAYMTTSTDTISWKFPEAILDITRTDLENIVTAISQHVQTQFNWEKTILEQIDAATTVEELRSISME